MKTATRKRDALDRLYDAVVDCFTPDVAAKIVALRADAKAQARLDDLADRHAESKLSEAELAEYDAFVNLDGVLGVLKVKCQKKFKQRIAS